MQYDLVVIGGGPAGNTAAIRAAKGGAKVLLIEKEQVGGTCLNRGCIPTKAILNAIGIYAKIKRAKDYGIEVAGVKIDYPHVLKQKNVAVSKVLKALEYSIRQAGVETITGEGELLAPGKIKVVSSAATKEIEAKNVLLATGSEPLFRAEFNIDEKNILTSDGILNLEEVPRSLIIIGGGAIGVEFATIYAELGTEVTVLEMMSHLLPEEDEEIGKYLESIFRRKKVKIVTGVKVKEIRPGDKPEVVLERGDPLTAEKVLVSVGRHLNTEGFEKLGVKMNGSKVVVNERMETSIKGVFAAGDITGQAMLAHAASFQGIIAAESILGVDSKINLAVMPSVIFTDPEVGTVGLTEKEAQAKGIVVKVKKLDFAGLGIAKAKGEIYGIVKIVAEEKSGRILGIHLIGPHATDLLGEATLAIARGATAFELKNVIHAHPTFPEALMEAADLF